MDLLAIPVDRAPVGTPWIEMTSEQQDQVFRDSIPHEEHLEEAYYMVGCAGCDTEHSAAHAAGTCEHCMDVGLLPDKRPIADNPDLR